MRSVTALFLVILLACPAWAAFKGPGTAAAPLTTVLSAESASEGATCILEGNITEQLQKDRYLFKDAGGSLTVNIPPHVFGSHEVTPDTLVRITGEMRGKKDAGHPDPHLGVRYLEVLK